MQALFLSFGPKYFSLFFQSCLWRGSQTFPSLVKFFVVDNDYGKFDFLHKSVDARRLDGSYSSSSARLVLKINWSAYGLISSTLFALFLFFEEFASKLISCRVLAKCFSVSGLTLSVNLWKLYKLLWVKIEEAPTTTWTRCELTDSFWQLTLVNQFKGSWLLSAFMCY